MHTHLQCSFVHHFHCGDSYHTLSHRIVWHISFIPRPFLFSFSSVLLTRLPESQTTNQNNLLLSPKRSQSLTKRKRSQAATDAKISAPPPRMLSNRLRSRHHGHPSGASSYMHGGSPSSSSKERYVELPSAPAAAFLLAPPRDAAYLLHIFCPQKLSSKCPCPAFFKLIYQKRLGRSPTFLMPFLAASGDSDPRAPHQPLTCNTAHFSLNQTSEGPPVSTHLRGVHECFLSRCFHRYQSERLWALAYRVAKDFSCRIAWPTTPPFSCYLP